MGRTSFIVDVRRLWNWFVFYYFNCFSRKMAKMGYWGEKSVSDILLVFFIVSTKSDPSDILFCEKNVFKVNLLQKRPQDHCTAFL